MLKNGSFSLRLVEKSDLNFLKELREDPKTNDYLGTFTLLNDVKQELWFSSINNNISQCYMIFEKEEDNKPTSIGMVRITEIDYINRSMCVGGDILPKFRGKKYAPEMYKLIFKYGFDCMNMHRLWLYVLDQNERAIKLYNKMGFKLEGIARDAIFKDGKYQNYQMMSILKGEYYDQRNDSII